MVSLSGGTIIGSSAYSYNNSTYYYLKGVFVEYRTVTLSPFQIAKYETTYELWYEVRQWAISTERGAGVYTFANAGREGHNGTAGDPPTTAKTEPVTMINWRDAVIWCNAYSEMSGKEPVYYTSTSYGTVLRISTNDDGTDTAADKAVMKLDANGYRLPTEAQWEYAARGGGTPPFPSSFAYKWAETNTDEDIAGGLRDYAWYSVNSGNTTHPVGGKTENGAGIKDMSGNVWEWCWDWHEIIGTGTAPDPTGPASGSGRMHRGGSWYDDASYCAVARRNWHFPDAGFSNLGFRVVCGN
jgi:formylglycine-generating enzyme required for sulfatase activity